MCRRMAKGEDIVMEMSPQLLFVSGNVISLCVATIPARWNVKNGSGEKEGERKREQWEEGKAKTKHSWASLNLP